MRFINKPREEFMIINYSDKSHRHIPHSRKPLSSASRGSMLLTTVLLGSAWNFHQKKKKKETSIRHRWWSMCDAKNLDQNLTRRLLHKCCQMTCICTLTTGVLSEGLVFIIIKISGHGDLSHLRLTRPCARCKRLNGTVIHSTTAKTKLEQKTNPTSKCIESIYLKLYEALGT